MDDPAFPRLHIRPPRGWLNDPNGLCRIDGRYHVFFQYNPYSPLHADICWGHVSSPDLLRWTEEPVALVRRSGHLDAAGCWSGCLVDDAGVPTAVYSAVPDDAENAAVVLARSDRTLRVWRQDEAPAAGPPALPGVTEARDPFVFTHGGRRYAVQGAGRPGGGAPQILLYDCSDLTRWRLLGPLLTTTDPVAAEVAAADIWECPNLVQVDGRWVLILSRWRQREQASSLVGVVWLLGELEGDGDGLRFTAETGGPFDTGPAYYAPQALPVDGRVLVWGWSWELARSVDQIADAGWAGVLTFPRELSVADGRLRVQPPAELVGLRRHSVHTDEPLPAAFELVADQPLDLRLDGEPVVQTSGPARVLVDGSMVEVFEGPVPSTTRAYPSVGSRWKLAGGARRVWALGLGQETSHPYRR